MRHAADTCAEAKPGPHAARWKRSERQHQQPWSGRDRKNESSEQKDRTGRGINEIEKQIHNMLNSAEMRALRAYAVPAVLATQRAIL